MKAKLLTLSILFILSFSCLWAEALPEKGTALFSSATGQVMVRAMGGKVRQIHKQDKTYSGETIQVGARSEAVILMADGSTLDLMANSRMALASLKQDSPGEKNFLIKLGLGKVVAMVTHLMSAHSTFEIEAGGVICGVRGTQFSVDYDSKKDKGEVFVNSGVVDVTGKGKTITLAAGGHTFFQRGLPWSGVHTPAGGPPPPPKVPASSGALNDLIGQYSGGIKVNTANTFTTAQQTLGLHLIVPTGEGKP
jgi:hypothetical protein